jgi:hypothetical protein
MKSTGESRSTRGKTCPSVTLSTINPTRTDPGSNPGLRGGRPATNRLSHGTVNNHSYHTQCRLRGLTFVLSSTAQTRIVGSNPTEGINVSSCCVLHR